MNSKFMLLAAAASASLVVCGATEERGIHRGRLTLHPYVSFSYTYDSNIDSGKHGKNSSQWNINPGLNLDYAADNWSLDAAFFYTYHAFQRYSGVLNTSSYGQSLKYDYSNVNNGRGWTIILTEKFHEMSQDDDMTNDGGRGIGRDRKQWTFDGQIQRQLNRYFHAGINGGYYFLEYANNVDKYAPLYGWKRASVNGQLGWAISEHSDFVLSGGYQHYWQDNDKDLYADRRDYTEEARGRNIGSESKGYTVSGGLQSHTTNGRLSYRGTVGWSWFEYAEGVHKSGGLVYNVSANWKINNTLNMMLLGSSFYQPSEREYGSSIKAYTISWGLGKSLVRGKLTGTFDLAYRKEIHEYTEYSADDYDEDIYTARLGLTYRLCRWMDMFCNFEYQDEETESGGARSHEFDYDRWRATLGFRLTY